MADMAKSAGDRPPPARVAGTGHVVTEVEEVEEETAGPAPADEKVAEEGPTPQVAGRKRASSSDDDDNPGSPTRQSKPPAPSTGELSESIEEEEEKEPGTRRGRSPVKKTTNAAPCKPTARKTTGSEVRVPVEEAPVEASVDEAHGRQKVAASPTPPAASSSGDRSHLSVSRSSLNEPLTVCVVRTRSPSRETTTTSTTVRANRSGDTDPTTKKLGSSSDRERSSSSSASPSTCCATSRTGLQRKADVAGTSSAGTSGETSGETSAETGRKPPPPPPAVRAEAELPSSTTNPPPENKTPHPVRGGSPYQDKPARGGERTSPKGLQNGEGMELRNQLHTAKDISIPGHLELRKSLVTPNKLGIWSLEAIPEGTVFGPFQGEKLTQLKKDSDPFCVWEVADVDTKEFLFYIDASRTDKANWMRYVQCARYFEEQNVVSEQEGIDIMYKTIKPIAKSEELLTWYKAPTVRRGQRQAGRTTQGKAKSLNELACKPGSLKTSPVPATVNETFRGRDSVKKELGTPQSASKEAANKDSQLKTASSVATVQQNSFKGLVTAQYDELDFEDVESDKNSDDLEIDLGDAEEEEGEGEEEEMDPEEGQEDDEEEEMEGDLVEESDAAYDAKVDGGMEDKGDDDPQEDPEKFQFKLKKQHITKSRHGRKVFRCDICCGIYRHAFSLKRHYIRNHVNLKYVCRADILNCQINTDAHETVGGGGGEEKANPSGSEAEPRKDYSGERGKVVVTPSPVAAASSADVSIKVSNPKSIPAKVIPRHVMSPAKTVCDGRKAGDVKGSSPPPPPPGGGASSTSASHLSKPETTTTTTTTPCAASSSKAGKKEEKLPEVGMEEEEASAAGTKGSKQPPLHGLFRCNVCTAFFDTAAKLKAHLENHPSPCSSASASSSCSSSSSKAFPCDKCDMKFAHKQNLIRHLAVHTGEKPFVCRFCGKKFPTATNQKRHERIHLGRRVACDYCASTFTQSGDLKKHVRKLHPQCFHECAFCGKYFNDEDELAEHVAGHHNESLASNEAECHRRRDAFRVDLERDRRESMRLAELRAPGFKFACTVCKKRFHDYANMCRHRRLAHQRHLLMGAGAAAAAGSSSPSPVPSPTKLSSSGEEGGGNDSERQAFFYANVAKNISDNLNNYMEGTKEHIKRATHQINVQRKKSVEPTSAAGDIKPPHEAQIKDFGAYNFPSGFCLKENYRKVVDPKAKLFQGKARMPRLSVSPKPDASESRPSDMKKLLDAADSSGQRSKANADSFMNLGDIDFKHGALVKPKVESEAATAAGGTPLPTTNGVSLNIPVFNVSGLAKREAKTQPVCTVQPFQRLTPTTTTTTTPLAAESKPVESAATSPPQQKLTTATTPPGTTDKMAALAVLDMSRPIPPVTSSSVAAMVAAAAASKQQVTTTTTAAAATGSKTNSSPLKSTVMSASASASSSCLALKIPQINVCPVCRRLFNNEAVFRQHMIDKHKTTTTTTATHEDTVIKESGERSSSSSSSAAVQSPPPAHRAVSAAEEQRTTTLGGSEPVRQQATQTPPPKADCKSASSPPIDHDEAARLLLGFAFGIRDGPKKPAAGPAAPSPSPAASAPTPPSAPPPATPPPPPPPPPPPATAAVARDEQDDEQLPLDLSGRNKKGGHHHHQRERVTSPHPPRGIPKRTSPRPGATPDKEGGKKGERVVVAPAAHTSLPAHSSCSADSSGQRESSSSSSSSSTVRGLLRIPSVTPLREIPAPLKTPPCTPQSAWLPQLPAVGDPRPPGSSGSGGGGGGRHQRHRSSHDRGGNHNHHHHHHHHAGAGGGDNSSEPKKFICTVCYGEFPSRGALHSHQRATHPNVRCDHVEVDNDVVAPWWQKPSPVGMLSVCSSQMSEYDQTEQQQFQCTKCSKSFFAVEELHSHIFECASVRESQTQATRPPRPRPCMLAGAKQHGLLGGGGGGGSGRLDVRAHALNIPPAKAPGPPPRPPPPRPPAASAQHLFMKSGPPSSSSSSSQMGLLPRSSSTAGLVKKVKKKKKKKQREQESELLTKKRRRSLELLYNPQNHVRRREIREVLDMQQCRGCGQRFSTISLLERHVPVCEHKDRLRKMQMSRTPLEMLADHAAEAAVRHVCRYCNKTFTYGAMLRKHVFEACAVRRARIQSAVSGAGSEAALDEEWEQELGPPTPATSTTTTHPTASSTTSTTSAVDSCSNDGSHMDDAASTTTSCSSVTTTSSSSRDVEGTTTGGGRAGQQQRRRRRKNRGWGNSKKRRTVADSGGGGDWQSSSTTTTTITAGSAKTEADNVDDQSWEDADDDDDDDDEEEETARLDQDAQEQGFLGDFNVKNPTNHHVKGRENTSQKNILKDRSVEAKVEAELFQCLAEAQQRRLAQTVVGVSTAASSINRVTESLSTAGGKEAPKGLGDTTRRNPTENDRTTDVKTPHYAAARGNVHDLQKKGHHHHHQQVPQGKELLQKQATEPSGGGAELQRASQPFVLSVPQYRERTPPGSKTKTPKTLPTAAAAGAKSGLFGGNKRGGESGEKRKLADCSSGPDEGGRKAKKAATCTEKNSAAASPERRPLGGGGQALLPEGKPTKVAPVTNAFVAGSAALKAPKAKDLKMTDAPHKSKTIVIGGGSGGKMVGGGGGGGGGNSRPVDGSASSLPAAAAAAAISQAVAKTFNPAVTNSAKAVALSPVIPPPKCTQVVSPNNGNAKVPAAAVVVPKTVVPAASAAPKLPAQTKVAVGQAGSLVDGGSPPPPSSSSSGRQKGKIEPEATEDGAGTTSSSSSSVGDGVHPKEESTSLAPTSASRKDQPPTDSSISAAAAASTKAGGKNTTTSPVQAAKSPTTTTTTTTTTPSQSRAEEASQQQEERRDDDDDDSDDSSDEENIKKIIDNVLAARKSGPKKQKAKASRADLKRQQCEEKSAKKGKATTTPSSTAVVSPTKSNPSAPVPKTEVLSKVSVHQVTLAEPREADSSDMATGLKDPAKTEQASTATCSPVKAARSPVHATPKSASPARQQPTINKTCMETVATAVAPVQQRSKGAAAKLQKATSPTRASKAAATPDGKLVPLPAAAGVNPARLKESNTDTSTSDTERTTTAADSPSAGREPQRHKADDLEKVPAASQPAQALKSGKVQTTAAAAGAKTSSVNEGNLPKSKSSSPAKQAFTKGDAPKATPASKLVQKAEKPAETKESPSKSDPKTAKSKDKKKPQQNASDESGKSVKSSKECQKTHASTADSKGGSKQTKQPPQEKKKKKNAKLKRKAESDSSTENEPVAPKKRLVEEKSPPGKEQKKEAARSKPTNAKATVTPNATKKTGNRKFPTPGKTGQGSEKAGKTGHTTTQGDTTHERSTGQMLVAGEGDAGAARNRKMKTTTTKAAKAEPAKVITTRNGLAKAKKTATQNKPEATPAAAAAAAAVASTKTRRGTTRGQQSTPSEPAGGSTSASKSAAPPVSGAAASSKAKPPKLKRSLSAAPRPAGGARGGQAAVSVSKGRRTRQSRLSL